MNRTVNDHIQDLIKCKGVDKGCISDGFHIFDELYEHRNTLYISLLRKYQEIYHPIETDGKSSIWKSRVHSDGKMYDGWFILGFNKNDKKQLTYHLPEICWDECWFAETLSKAPEWDGHSFVDVLKRIKEL